MQVIIGEVIKKILVSRKMKLKDFAEDLGMARQNVYRIFEKDSIETDLLIKVSSVLNYNFFQHFDNQGLDVVSDLPVALNSTLPALEHELETCRNELRLARKEIEYLKKIIDLMEERTKLLSNV
ncbi:MAG TPA: helix-turn-helix transcriptional regulator [Chryseolinea sp.]|nr:helix-turn-helix transcriptional regulator [Chryseolinea sp.]